MLISNWLMNDKLMNLLIILVSLLSAASPIQDDALNVRLISDVMLGFSVVSLRR